MRNLIAVVLFAFLFILASCHINGKSTNTNKLPDSLNVEIIPSNNYSILDANKQDFEIALKKYCSHFVHDTLNFVKVDSTIKLPIENGESVCFKDTLSWENEDVDSRLFGYLGNYPEIGYYLVEGKYYENYSCILINKKNGNIAYLGGIPKISPNNELLLNINEIGGMGNEHIGFQIWTYNKNKSNWISLDKSNSLAWQTDDAKVKTPWYPIDFVWESDKVAILKVISFKSEDFAKNNYKNSNDCVYKRLIIKITIPND